MEAMTEADFEYVPQIAMAALLAETQTVVDHMVATGQGTPAQVLLLRATLASGCIVWARRYGSPDPRPSAVIEECRRYVAEHPEEMAAIDAAVEAL